MPPLKLQREVSIRYSVYGVGHGAREAQRLCRHLPVDGKEVPASAAAPRETRSSGGGYRRSAHGPLPIIST